MNKRKLSKSYFTLWCCCVILGYLGTLSLEKPDILVKYDIISKSLRDEQQRGRIFPIFILLNVSAPLHFSDGGIALFTSLHLFDSFNYFRKLAAYKTQYMFNN